MKSPTKKRPKPKMVKMTKKDVRDIESIFKNWMVELQFDLWPEYTVELDRDFRGKKPRLIISLYKSDQSGVVAVRRYPKS